MMQRCFNIFLRTLCWAPLLCLASLVVNTVLHIGFGICMLHLAHFARGKAIRIGYGLPTREMVELQRRNRIVIGGCVVTPLEAACPHCHWPVRLSH